MASKEKIHTEFEVLQDAADQFLAAIEEFKRTYTPSTVDLKTWVLGIEDVLLDIYEDIEVELESR
jgi:hypothetical protein